MPAYHLPDHVHFGEIGGQRVFLDLAADRYFSLPPEADAAFSSLQLTDPDAESHADQIAFLLRAGVLVAAPHGRPIARTCHERPRRSLVEAWSHDGGYSPINLLETWLLVRRARSAVANRRLPRLLQALSRRRPASPDMAVEPLERTLARFRAARRLVPIAPNCLYDSLALCRFLQRRGLGTDLIIGAKLFPFAAHCWLQQGDAVLNDSLAAARDFEPVLVA